MATIQPLAVPGTQSRGSILQDLGISLLIPSVITVCLRIYVRGHLIKSLGWDDMVMVASLISFIVYCASLFLMVSYGAGGHLPEGPAVDRVIKMFIFTEVFYSLTMLLLKISLGIFFLRLVVRRWERRLVYVFTLLPTLVNFSCIFFAIFMCGDPKLFIEHVKTFQCASGAAQLGIAYYQAGINALTDWFFAILPFFILYKSQMDRRTKYSAGFVLTLGTIGSVCAIVRLAYVNGLAPSPDFFYNIFNVGIISTCELALGITAGSLATLRPLFKKYFPKAQSTARAATSWISSHHSPHQGSRGSKLSSKHRLAQGRGNAPLSWKGVSSGSTRTTVSGTMHSEKACGAIPLTTRLNTVEDEHEMELGNLEGDSERGLDTFWVDDIEQGDLTPYSSLHDIRGISKTVNVDITYRYDLENFNGASTEVYVEQPTFPPPSRRST